MLLASHSNVSSVFKNAGLNSVVIMAYIGIRIKSWSSVENIFQILNMMLKVESFREPYFGMKDRWNMNQMLSNIRLKLFSRQPLTEQCDSKKYIMTEMKCHYELTMSLLKNSSCTIEIIIYTNVRFQRMFVMSISGVSGKFRA